MINPERKIYFLFGSDLKDRSQEACHYATQDILGDH